MSKLYVLVNGDLSRSQQAVQSAHVVAEFMLYSNNACNCCRDNKHWKNETIVLLKAKNRNDLEMWGRKIYELEVPQASFFEPDIMDTTALAAYDTDGRLQDLLRDLPLV